MVYDQLWIPASKHPLILFLQFPGAVCSPDMKFLRYNIEGPKIEPPSLKGRDLIVTNAHGSVTVPYMVKRLTTEGWMGILYVGDTYEEYFDDSAQVGRRMETCPLPLLWDERVWVWRVQLGKKVWLWSL